MGTEFVLAAAQPLEDRDGWLNVSDARVFKRRAVHFWMLDFGAANKIELGEDRVIRTTPGRMCMEGMGDIW